jgi:hypothetical protein
MSIERHSNRDSDAAAQRQLEARKTDLRLHDQRREIPNAETVDRFRAAMQKQVDPRQAPTAREVPQPQQPGQRETKAGNQARLAEQAAGREDQGALQQSAAGSVKERVSRKEESGHQSSSSGSDGSTLDMASMWQAQMALRNDAPAMPATPVPVNTQAFAELIQRHVRQMAASDSALKDSDGQVLLRMSDATLPGTDLLLSRTTEGWRLRSDSRSRSSHDAICRAAPELAKRFADNDLGVLEIDPHFNG